MKLPNAVKCIQFCDHQVSHGQRFLPPKEQPLSKQQQQLLISSPGLSESVETLQSLGNESVCGDAVGPNSESAIQPSSKNAPNGESLRAGEGTSEGNTKSKESRGQYLDQINLKGVSDIITALIVDSIHISLKSRNYRWLTWRRKPNKIEAFVLFLSMYQI